MPLAQAFIAGQAPESIAVLQGHARPLVRRSARLVARREALAASWQVTRRDLATAKTNQAAQTLYNEQGWMRRRVFWLQPAYDSDPMICKHLLITSSKQQIPKRKSQPIEQRSCFLPGGAWPYLKDRQPATRSLCEAVSLWP